MYYDYPICILNCFVDVDPCSTEPCANNGACVNLVGGGFRCTCTPGWTGERCDIGKARVKRRTSHEPNPIQPIRLM